MVSCQESYWSFHGEMGSLFGAGCRQLVFGGGVRRIASCASHEVFVNIMPLAISISTKGKHPACRLLHVLTAARPVHVGEWSDAQWKSSRGSYHLFHGEMGSLIGAGCRQLLQFQGWAGTVPFEVSLRHLDWRQCARLLARSCFYSFYVT